VEKESKKLDLYHLSSFWRKKDHRKKGFSSFFIVTQAADDKNGVVATRLALK
jgi:hypothetical protein